MKFLVIGGAGYIGSHCARFLVRNGHQVCVFDNLSRGSRESLPEPIEFVLGDVTEEAGIAAALKQSTPDVVLHFAALALVAESTAQPELYYFNNCFGMMQLLKALLRYRADCPLVFSSTCAVFGPPKQLPLVEAADKAPISAYGASKLAAEMMLQDYVRAHKMRAMTLRYFNACGAEADGSYGEDHQPETHLIPNILRGLLHNTKVTVNGTDFPTPDGSCLRDYIHVEDLAIAHLRAAEHLVKQQQPYYEVAHLGTGQPYSVYEIIKAAAEVTGLQPSVAKGPRRLGDPAALYTDTSHAQQLLGLRFENSKLSTIISSAWKWHQQHPHGYRDKRLHLAR